MYQRLLRAVQGLLRHAGIGVHSGWLVDLISGARHSPQLQRHRLRSIQARVRVVALLFVVPTLLWIALDVATLASVQWQVLAVLRVLAACAFAVLALAPHQPQSRWGVLLQLGVLLAIPMVIYGVSVHLFAWGAHQGWALTNVRLYAALPLVVMAGISIFPLVVLEGFTLALALGVVVAALQLQAGVSSVQELLAVLWVQVLVVITYLIACAMQLHYMGALLREASHDKLTGALTRASGSDVMGIYYRLSCQQGTPFAVLFLDLDHFKAINDGYGHEAGDAALQGMVRSLQKHLRKADVVVRWGGEEFVVLLTNTGMQSALEVVNRMMIDGFGQRPDGRPLTASMGLAERLVDGGDDWTHLVKLADERMYLAKSRGRARCVSQSG